MTESIRTFVAPAPARLIDFTGPARLYARCRTARIARADAARAQRATLLRLLRQAQETAFGRAHGFSGIDGVESFQRAVPLRDYSAFWSEWWGDAYPMLVNVSWPGQIPFFSMTSGTTTGRSKFIPYTRDMRRAAVRGFLDLLCYHLVRRPHSRVLGGTALGLTGPALLDDNGNGVATGAVSAIASGAVPAFLGHRILPPAELANVADWQEKIRRLAPMSLASDLRFLGGSPNWMLIFLEEVARHCADRPEKLVTWYPNLELIVHGGVNFAPYRHKFGALMQGTHAETRELYSASEGVFAYADRGDGDGLRLHLDGNIFYEFVPTDALSSDRPERHWIKTAEPGVNYALAITSAAGLWSYLVGDTVRLISRSPPRLLVTGRVQQGLSAFGEHLIEAEIAEAVATAARATGLAVLDYCAGAVRDLEGGHHLYLIEPIALPAQNISGAIAKALDDCLCQLNEDYADLRKDDFAVAAPQVRLVEPGAFAAWMQTRRRLGGQNKVPRIVNDEALFADLTAFLLGHPARGGKP